jgi:predicted Rossmann-fold nucleotide-binding protein
VPIVVVDRSYWTRVVNFDLLVEEGMITRQEFDTLVFADTAEEAWQALLDGGLALPAQGPSGP